MVLGEDSIGIWHPISNMCVCVCFFHLEEVVFRLLECNDDGWVEKVGGQKVALPLGKDYRHPEEPFSYSFIIYHPSICIHYIIFKVQFIDYQIVNIYS